MSLEQDRILETLKVREVEYLKSIRVTEIQLSTGIFALSLSTLYISFEIITNGNINLDSASKLLFKSYVFLFVISILFTLYERIFRLFQYRNRVDHIRTNLLNSGTIECQNKKIIEIIREKESLRIYDKLEKFKLDREISLILSLFFLVLGFSLFVIFLLRVYL